MQKPNVDLTAVKNFLANFIVPLASLIIAGLLFFFVIYPSLGKVPTLESDLENKQSQAQKLEEKRRKLNTFLDFEDNIEENKELVSKALVSEPLVPQLLTQIDTIAREAGLEVTQMSYSLGNRGSRQAQSAEEEEAPTQQAKDVVVSLGTSGTYDQTVSFLSSIEKAARVINVTDIRYTTDNDDENILDVSFTLNSPYVEIETAAVTDDPIGFDVTDSTFQSTMETLKNYRVYEISIEDLVDIENLPGEEEAEEGTETEEETTQPAETTEETTEETVPTPEPETTP